MTDGDEVAAHHARRAGERLHIEADLLDPHVPARLFDVAEAELGPVDIVVNNATGWASGDSFTAGITDPAAAPRRR